MDDLRFVSHKKRHAVSGYYFECPFCSEEYFIPGSEVGFLDDDPENYILATCEDCGEDFAIGQKEVTNNG